MQSIHQVMVFFGLLLLCCFLSHDKSLLLLFADNLNPVAVS